MVSFYCRACGEERELEFGRPPGFFFCDRRCAEEFVRVADHLLNGGDPAEIDLDPGSRLFCEAVKDVEAHRRAERSYAREMREVEFESNRPRLMKVLYPC